MGEQRYEVQHSDWTDDDGDPISSWIMCGETELSLRDTADLLNQQAETIEVLRGMLNDDDPEMKMFVDNERWWASQDESREDFSDDDRKKILESRRRVAALGGKPIQLQGGSVEKGGDGNA